MENRLEELQRENKELRIHKNNYEEQLNKHELNLIATKDKNENVEQEVFAFNIYNKLIV